MKKALTLALLGTVALSSCSVVGTRAAVVSGQLNGFNSDQNLRLALVGFNNSQYVADGRRAQVIDKVLTGGYTFALPRNVQSGVYRLIVFRDVNNNNAYDSGDVVLSRHNGKSLIYAPRDNYIYSGVKYGWNIRNDANGDIQTVVLNNYDLTAAR
ncbi:hypothetical protein [Deinococcus sp. PESE-13]